MIQRVKYINNYKDQTADLTENKTKPNKRIDFFMLAHKNYCRPFYDRLRKEKIEGERVKQHYVDNLRDKETKLKRSEAWQVQRCDFAYVAQSDI